MCVISLLHKCISTFANVLSCSHIWRSFSFRLVESSEGSCCCYLSLRGKLEALQWPWWPGDWRFYISRCQGSWRIYLRPHLTGNPLRLGAVVARSCAIHRSAQQNKENQPVKSTMGQLSTYWRWLRKMEQANITGVKSRFLKGEPKKHIQKEQRYSWWRVHEWAKAEWLIICRVPQQIGLRSKNENCLLDV